MNDNELQEKTAKQFKEIYKRLGELDEVKTEVSEKKGKNFKAQLNDLKEQTKKLEDKYNTMKDTKAIDWEIVQDSFNKIGNYIHQLSLQLSNYA